MVDRAKLKTPKPKADSGNSEVKFRIPPPQVRVAPPQVKVAAPQVSMDPKPIANAIDRLAGLMGQLAQQQYALLEMLREHNRAIENAVDKEPVINVKAPAVNMPPRPRSYSVEIEDENGETVQMTIEANSPH